MFKIGDVVHLKSNPNVDLTVKDIDGDDVIVIYYSQKTDRFEDYKWHRDLLEPSGADIYTPHW